MTENPSFEINAALLSRARVLTLEPLIEGDVGKILRRAMADDQDGLAALKPRLSEGDLDPPARASAGDARVALMRFQG